MILTGDPYENGEKGEVLDILDHNNKVQTNIKTNKRYGAVGCILKNDPLICGGKIGYYGLNMQYFNDGFSATNNSANIHMLEKRAHASGVLLSNGKIWIFGGTDGKIDHANSEFVAQNEPAREGTYKYDV